MRARRAARLSLKVRVLRLIDRGPQDSAVFAGNLQLGPVAMPLGNFSVRQKLGRQRITASHPDLEP